MLVIRMQRTGRKGHAMFRVVVQDSRRTPSSGKVVANLGSYDPHSKNVSLNAEQASFYLEHGAQPSDRVARLLQAEGVTLPKWVALSANKQRTVRNADKRRSTTSAPDPEPETEVPAEPTGNETPAETNQDAAEANNDTAETLSDETAETVAEAAAETAPSEDSATVETEAEAEAATDAEAAARADIEADSDK